MSVSALPLNSTLVLKYQIGVTPEGSPIFRQKSLNNVRADATEQAVFEVATALFSLCQDPELHVFLRKNSELIDE